ncbi:hypothetical protein C5673_28080 [Klebsiella quasipneumoniae]|nr:hypothetical protein C5673_28080 [Klebsiella quasipneumoniae]
MIGVQPCALPIFYSRALLISAPDEPQKIYGFNEPFRFTGSSTGRWAVSIINISIRKTRSVIL